MPNALGVMGRYWEVPTGAVLIIWRVLCCPAAGLWKDWIIVLAAWWIFTAIFSRSRAWNVVTTLAAAYLLMIHAWGQAPHTVAVLGALP